MDSHAKIVMDALKHVKKFDTYMDIGANVGLTSLPLCDKFDNVIAVEPNPVALKEFKENDLPTNLTILEKGMYDKEGTMTLVMPNDNTEHSSLEPKRTSQWGAVETKQEWEVDVITLDSLELDSLDLLKIDVEQGENAVIAGGFETIKRLRPVIVFENKRNEAKKAAKLLISLKYKLQAKKGNTVAFYVGKDR